MMFYGCSTPADQAATLENRLKRLEVEYCWMLHDGADPVDLAIQRAMIEDTRAVLQRVDIAAYLGLGQPGLAMMQPGVNLG